MSWSEATKSGYLSLIGDDFVRLLNSQKGSSFFFFCQTKKDHL